jgi:hypothetical protein
LLHLEAGFNNPLGSWHTTSLLKGVRRHLGDTVNRKLPITPRILLAIRQLLDLTKPFDIVFWAACLVGFYSLLRKSNLLPPSPCPRTRHHLCRRDVIRSPAGLALCIRHSKTIQFQERSLHAPLPFIPSHPLCPVTALVSLLCLGRHLPGDTPLFSFATPMGVTTLTQPHFSSRLSHCITDLGLRQDHYSCHSLRRGGASWLHEAGMPGEYIQVIGDWKSDAYKLYLSIDLEGKFNIINQYTNSLPYS